MPAVKRHIGGIVMREPTGRTPPNGRPARSAGRPASRTLLANILFLAAFIASSAGALEVWTGPSINFTNFSVSDVDQITPSVWITRGSRRGIYNAAVESTFATSLSPIGTEWAYGELTNYASLVYTDWEDWYGGPGNLPDAIVGHDAVLHIIPEDVYIGIQFTSWGVGTGGFSYTRTTGPP